MRGQVAGQKNESKSCISPPWQVALLMTKCNLALAPSFLDLPYFTSLGRCCWFAPACNWWLVFISNANHRRSRAQPEGDTSIPGVRSLLSIYRPVMFRCSVFMFQNNSETGPRMQWPLWCRLSSHSFIAEEQLGRAFHTEGTCQNSHA